MHHAQSHVAPQGCAMGWCGWDWRWDSSRGDGGEGTERGLTPQDLEAARGFSRRALLGSRVCKRLWLPRGRRRGTQCGEARWCLGDVTCPSLVPPGVRNVPKVWGEGRRGENCQSQIAWNLGGAGHVTVETKTWCETRRSSMDARAMRAVRKVPSRVTWKLEAWGGVLPDSPGCVCANLPAHMHLVSAGARVTAV